MYVMLVYAVALPRVRVACRIVGFLGTFHLLTRETHGAALRLPRAPGHGRSAVPVA